MDTTTFNPMGVDLFGEPITDRKAGALAKEYIVPPFSVLSARDGSWQDRKRAWLALGIQSELGRGAELIATSPSAASVGGASFAGNRGGKRASPGGSLMPATDYSKGQRGDSTGKPLGARPSGKIQDYDHYRKKEGIREDVESAATSTSIFDPVLCELTYRWWCPPGGQIVDPFAGGSVRGIVATMMGYRYWGCDLAGAQVLANYQQAQDVIGPDKTRWPEWHQGDSAETLADAPDADFIFSCPPYGDLEVYSDDPRDLSTMQYCDFLAVYSKIIALAVSKLKPRHYACFVVGDFRDKRTGHYRGFPEDTVNIFREHGCPKYNEGILLTAIGSLPVRVSGQFEASRKLGKAHQNVLVFQKK